mgnify:CR=1 FL=1
MKALSIKELTEIRDRMKNQVTVREGGNRFRVVVGMATCGIAAGARPVMNALLEEVSKEGLEEQVHVSQTGCIGFCQYEPIVEVFKGEEKYTYVEMTPDKVREVVDSHLKNGTPVLKYTIKL